MIASVSILDEVLRVATVDDMLRLAGVAVPEDAKKPLLCPLHAERSPSFYRQRSGKGYRCQGCGAHGGVLELATALKLAPTRPRAVELLAAHYGLAKGLSGAPPRWSAKPFRQFALPPLEPPPVLNAEERSGLAEAVRDCCPILGTPGAAYLASRGVNPSFADACRIRFHPSWLGRGEAVVFPGYDSEGKLVCAQGRFAGPGSGPKAMSRGKVAIGVFATPGGLAKGFYGQDTPVAIAEAPIDALALAQNGLPTVALFGAGNRQAWLRCALAWRHVVLAFDSDDAGEKAAEDFLLWLNLGTTKIRVRFDPCKDAAEVLESAPERLARLVEETLAQIRSRYSITVPEANVPDGPSLLAYAASVLDEEENLKN